MPSQFDRRHFLQLGLLGAAGLATHSDAAPPRGAAEGEVLYNGIRLPSPWPPRLKEVPRDPVVPAYLTAPPAVIPIDVGRQLFVDDFLVATSTLTRTHHLPTYHARSPVLTGGMVKVTVATEAGMETTLAVRSRGDLIGEFAVLDGMPRTATARAVGTVGAVRIIRAAFTAF